MLVGVMADREGAETEASGVREAPEDCPMAFQARVQEGLEAFQQPEPSVELGRRAH